MKTTTQVRKKGQITIPSAIREKLNIEENDILSISVLNDDAIVIVPKKLKVLDLLDKTSDLAKKRGVSLEEMLVELDEIRHNA